MVAATDGDQNNGNQTALDRYTLRLNIPAANDKIKVEDRAAATGTTTTVRMGLNTTDSWVAVLVAYR